MSELTERGETPPRVLSWHGRTATAATMQSPRSVSSFSTDEENGQ